ncbi:hypothetical protein O7627_24175 [Solwaraspora sp. WMMD1047]|uniref:hypothetical protein n=1 Tax=Solwaraspora sp. WMMD1047 TaxID=3016102 RepID=UPI0024178BB9|nr:hypothetical protein [Solwaraspora sp. WMMD1047]MDG4832380.1 hypothetical protein [Solwaraspora sp. WMMD1047]
MSGDIHLILDASAIIAYAHASIHVGETIAEIADEEGRFAVPTVCLAEAGRRLLGADDPRVLLLVQHPHAVVTGVPAQEWGLLTKWSVALGRLDLAAAMVEASVNGAYVLTSEPEAYGDWKDGPVIPI